MELNIGENIKKLRLEKGLTQEQLADILGVSSAAVSKWEAKNTYPDITMLIPLAQVFRVSMDDLLRYDELKIQANIENILAEYKRLGVEGRHHDALDLITLARENYPNDFRVMIKYICAHLRSVEVLSTKTVELNHLCDCILENCTQDSIRADALFSKAKIMHYNGNTDDAIKLLDSLPKSQAALLTEQLFSKDSEEYRLWNRRNCYSLLHITAIKHARMIQYDPNISDTEKIGRLCALAESYESMSKTQDFSFYCIGAEAIYFIAANMATINNFSIEETIRIREKHLKSIQSMMNHAETDSIMQELIEETYGTRNLLQHQLNILKHTTNPLFANPRKNALYMEMLSNWGNP